MDGTPLPFHYLVLGPLLVVPLLFAVAFILRRQAGQVRQNPVLGLAGQWRAMTSSQRRTTLAIGAGFIIFIFLLGQSTRATHESILRRQFLLPNEVAVSHVRVAKRSSAERPAVEAIAQFSEKQFRDYARKLEDPGFWQPALLSIDGAPVNSYSPGALRWNWGPQPRQAGGRRISWGEMSRGLAAANRTGWVFCFALVPYPEAPSFENGYRRPDHYSAYGCSEVSRSEKADLFVVGMLDGDDQTLHMRIN